MEKSKFERMISAVENRLPNFIYVKPLVISGVENFGLEREGRVLFPGCSIICDLSYVESNGVTMYKVAIDERFLDGMKISEDEKTTRAREIREEVAYLEYKNSFNILDPDDVNFWSKVKTFRADNEDYWKNVTVKLENFGFVLNTRKVEDRVIYHCIKGGGFSLIAPDIETGLSNPSRFKFYMEVPSDMKILTKGRIIKNTAVSILSDLYNRENKPMLFYMTKCLHKSSVTMKYDDWGIDRLYLEIDNWFSGNYATCVHHESEKLYNRFISLSNNSLKRVAVEALVGDLMTMSHIVYRNSESSFFSSDLNEMLGNTKEDVASYLASDSGYTRLEKLVSLYGDKYGFVKSVVMPEIKDVGTALPLQENTETTVQQVAQTTKPKPGFKKTIKATL